MCHARSISSVGTRNDSGDDVMRSRKLGEELLVQSQRMGKTCVWYLAILPEHDLGAFGVEVIQLSPPEFVHLVNERPWRRTYFIVSVPSRVVASESPYSANQFNGEFSIIDICAYDSAKADKIGCTLNTVRNLECRGCLHLTSTINHHWSGMLSDIGH